MRLLLLMLFAFTMITGYAQDSDIEKENENKDMKMEEEISEKADVASSDDNLFNYVVPEQIVFAEDKLMSSGTATAFVLVVDDMKGKDVKNRWKDFMKAFDSKTKKVKGAKNESLNRQVKMYDVSSSPIDIFSTNYENGRSNEFVVWIKDGDDFITADSEQAVHAKKMMKNFGVFIERTKIEKELEEAEDLYKKRTKEYDKLVKQKRDLEHDIVEWKKDILEAEQKIEQNILDQENKTKEVSTQKEAYDVVKKKLSLF